PNYIDNLVMQEASEKGAAVETKGKSRRSTYLKGHVVEEGEAEASEWRSMRDEEGKDNDVDTDVEWDLNIWILEGERRWRQKNSRGVGDGTTAMLERKAMKGRVWSATEERQQVFCYMRSWKRLLLLCFCRETEVATLHKRSRLAAAASQKRS
ncbi:hypothetical protein GW17_00048982, partial [Ensete ventricosum]